MASRKNRTASRKAKDADIKKRIVRACQLRGDPCIENLFWAAAEYANLAARENASVMRDIETHKRQVADGHTIDPPKYLRTYVNQVRKQANCKKRMSERSSVLQAA